MEFLIRRLIEIRELETRKIKDNFLFENKNKIILHNEKILDGKYKNKVNMNKRISQISEKLHIFNPLITTSTLDKGTRNSLFQSNPIEIKGKKESILVHNIITNHNVQKSHNFNLILEKNNSQKETRPTPRSFLIPSQTGVFNPEEVFKTLDKNLIKSERHLMPKTARSKGKNHEKKKNHLSFNYDDEDDIGFQFGSLIHLNTEKFKEDFNIRIQQKINEFKSTEEKVLTHKTIKYQNLSKTRQNFCLKSNTKSFNLYDERNKTSDFTSQFKDSNYNQNPSNSRTPTVSQHYISFSLKNKTKFYNPNLKFLKNLDELNLDTLDSNKNESHNLNEKRGKRSLTSAIVRRCEKGKILKDERKIRQNSTLKNSIKKVNSKINEMNKLKELRFAL